MSWTLIESQTLGTAAASVTFSAIPQTFKTLVVAVSARTNRTSDLGDFVSMRFNGDASSIYDGRRLNGNGTAVTSSTDSSYTQLVIAGTDGNLETANVFGNTEFRIPNYSGSAYKTVSADSVPEINGTSPYTYMTLGAGLWRSIAAINSIVLIPQNGSSFVAVSTFTLYGLK